MAFFNLRKINKRVLIVIPLIIVLLSSLGGIFLWLGRETPPEEWEEAEYSKPEDYVVKETPEGRIVENKKAGLSFKIPEGWRIEKPDYGSYIATYSPDAVGTTRTEGGMEKGCEIITEVMYVKTNIKVVEEKLKELHKKGGFIDDEYAVLDIDGHESLKNTVGMPAFNLYGMSVHIPTKSKLYFLRVGSNLQDKEGCTQEFEQFLKTVSIE